MDENCIIMRHKEVGMSFELCLASIFPVLLKNIYNEGVLKCFKIMFTIQNATLYNNTNNRCVCCKYMHIIMIFH